MDNRSVNKILRSYQKPNSSTSTYYVVTTALAGYLGIFGAVYFYSSKPWITFLLYPIIFIALCRSFVILHDAGHYALYKTRWLNSLAGNLMGILNMIPNALWSYIHNLHHATVGSLEKRNVNPELWTMTTDEYVSSHLVKKLAYRFMRSSFSRLVVTPLGLFVVARLPLPNLNIKGKLSAILYDLLYAVIIYLSVRYDFWEALIFGYVVPLFVFNVLATIIFYLQHQFEDTLWLSKEDWNFYDASIEGSSYLRFGKFMQWVTANVGFHHIHHLNSGIPFYNLPKAHEEVKDEIKYKEVRIYEIFHHLRGKLWDERRKRLIHYSEIDGL